MWSFQYKHGDRPLEGYTIQRAAGRGGFGEVYYAVSDSGREVALKVVQGYEQIELRGISQCMNLKSPHLVTIFDVRYNTEGKPFVLMEYVAGPNLRQLIDESPAGLGTQKAAFFLREIAKGLSFLHDCGIVHRDLKPANIFYENGYVKIGDYGLSKAITTSQYSGQTVTVGTVHYMAPEIGAGKYDRSIDIYALGAVLYEMLTGMPPYVGASPTEVLMKHLSAEPDVSSVPQPFARVIQKAMAKDPTQRYQTVQEMVEDVFGAEHVRQSVSVFSPEDLSIIAERVAKKAPVAAGAAVGAGGTGAGSGGASSSLPGGQADPWARVGSWMDEVGGRVKHMWNEPHAPDAGVAPAQSAQPLAVNDPLSVRHRWQLAILVSLLAPLAAMLVSPNALKLPIVTFLFVLTLMWGTALGCLFAHRSILPRMGNDSVWVQRLIVGQLASLGAVLLSLPTWAAGSLSGIGGTLLAVLGPYFLFDSKDEIVPDRPERVQLKHLFGAGIAAFIVALTFRGHVQLAIAAAAGATLIVHILSPWDPVAAARAKAQGKYRDEDEEEEEDEDEEEKNSSEPGSRQRPASPAVAAIMVDPVTGKVQQIPVGHAPPPVAPPERLRYWSRPVWPLARIAWVIGVVAAIPIGVMFCVAGGFERNPNDVGPLVAAGVSFLLFGALAALKALQSTFYGWWGYLVKPVLMTACVAAITSSAIVLGNLSYTPTTDDVMVGTFFIVFPAVLLLVLLFIPGRFRATSRAAQPPPTPSQPGVSRSSRTIALVLCLLYFPFLAGGVHRLYVGRVKSGILWLVTFGLFGIGQIIDLILILSGNFTDVSGRRVLSWEFDASRATAPATPPPIPPSPPPAPTPAGGIGAAAAALAQECGREVSEAFQSIGTAFDWKPKRAARPVAPASVTLRSSLAGAELGISGLLSALAGLLIFVGTIAAIAIAVDVPGMLKAGVPTPEARIELESGIFRDIPNDWPHLLRQAATLAVGIVLFMGLTLMMFARRTGGVLHMLRGAVGVIGLMLAMLPLSSAFQRQRGWDGIGLLVSQKSYSGAVEAVLANFQSSAAIGAAVILLMSILILAWPPRKAPGATPVAKGA